MIQTVWFPRIKKGPLGVLLILGLPLGFWLVALIALKEPLAGWLSGESRYEQDILREWLEEARASRKPLPALVESYLELAKASPADELTRQQALVRREEIREHLRALGEPPTKVFSGQLPLFPHFFEILVILDDEPDMPIRWVAGFPYQANQVQRLEHRIHPRALARVYYQVHAYDRRTAQEKQAVSRAWWLGILAALVSLGVAIQALVSAARERSRRKMTEQSRQAAEDADYRRLEAEKQLLSQQLATEEAQKKALELRSQMYAGIGIMAGSYAHNIKNLLVRPMDLLRRCQEESGGNGALRQLLGEVGDTLSAVTARLQQILAAVRREPGNLLRSRYDLCQLVRETVNAWSQIAGDKWKLDLSLTLPPEEIQAEGDPSHVQQVLENLIFNARDATFEQRNHLREEARNSTKRDSETIRQAVLAAASWRGEIQLRLYQEGECAVLAVTDTGAGMTAESLAHCTDAYYSTRRDSAIYEGMSSGMGLGLSFVKTVLESMQGRLQIQSIRWQGATFKLIFPRDTRPDK